jgi:hypothetical protein
MAAGKQIARREYTRRNLHAIFEWKTGGRGKARLQVNTDEEIEDALRSAVCVSRFVLRRNSGRLSRSDGGCP